MGSRSRLVALAMFLAALLMPLAQGGAPVAALYLPPIRDVSPRVVIRDDLTEAIAAALALGHTSEQERRAFAQANSWRQRQERIMRMALDPVGPG